MKLYVVDNWRWVRAECTRKKDAEQQANEYLNNFWGIAYLDKYERKNKNIKRKCEYWEIEFYENEDAIFRDEYEKYWIQYNCLKAMEF